MRDRLFRGFRDVSRRWRARPGVVVMSVLTLGLAAGAGSAVFAVANATIARRLPFPDADHLVKIFSLPPQAKSFDDRNPLGSRPYVEFRKDRGRWQRLRGFGPGKSPRRRR